MKVQHVLIDYVNQVWPRVEYFLAPAVNQQHGEPDFLIEHVQQLVTSGQWILVVAVDDAGEFHGAATINFFNRPTGRIAFVSYLGGHLVSNHENMQQFRELCRTFGATRIEAAMNDNTAKLWHKLGFKEKYRIAEAIL